MTSSLRSSRWLVAAGVSAAVVATGLIAPRIADADPNLPSITAQQLLTRIASQKSDAFSGTVAVNSDLGLPDMSQFAEPHTEGDFALLFGSHTLRVWAAPGKLRVAQFGDMSEKTLVVDGSTNANAPTTVWTYDSHSRKATRKVVPGHAQKAGKPAHQHAQPPRTPQQFAVELLKGINPTTKVDVDRSITVAGRDAYQLRLVPRDGGTLVGSITMAVDAQNYSPLRVAITPRNSAAEAFSVGFTTVDFGTPAASVFRFTPPAGATVEQKDASKPDKTGTAVPRHPTSKTPKQEQAQVHGKGWSAVLSLTGDASATRSGAGESDGQLQQLLATLPNVSGSFGTGKVLTSRLITVLYVPGKQRVLLGMVDRNTLIATANAHR